jgi:hypothetical protein
MKRIAAPIDEKNVSTDWIEDVFNSCVRCDKQFVGFIDDAPVYVSWERNHLSWRCVEVFGFDTEKTIKEIKTRLSEFENPNSDLFSEMYVVGHCVVQSFYFRVD